VNGDEGWDWKAIAAEPRPGGGVLAEEGEVEVEEDAPAGVGVDGCGK
jgi:hypothetical protein